MSAVTVDMLESALIAAVAALDAARTSNPPAESVDHLEARSMVARDVAGRAVDLWAKAPALVRLGAVAAVVRRYW